MVEEGVEDDPFTRAAQGDAPAPREVGIAVCDWQGGAPSSCRRGCRHQSEQLRLLLEEGFRQPAADANGRWPVLPPVRGSHVGAESQPSKLLVAGSNLVILSPWLARAPRPQGAGGQSRHGPVLKWGGGGAGGSRPNGLRPPPLATAGRSG